MSTKSFVDVAVGPTNPTIRRRRRSFCWRPPPIIKVSSFQSPVSRTVQSHWEPATGNQSPISRTSNLTGNWQPVISLQFPERPISLGTGNWQLVTGNWSLTRSQSERGAHVQPGTYAVFDTSEGSFT